MVRFGWLLLILVASSQDDAVRDLVERLRADRSQEREDADRALRIIGPAALPALRAAALDADIDFSRRAAKLVQIIEVVRLLGPRVLEKIPGAEDLIGSAKDRAWTDLFLKAHGMPGITPAALEYLAPRALAGAAPPPENPNARRDPESEPGDDRRTVARIIAERGLRSAVPVLLSMLSSPDVEARECAALALGHLRVREALPLLRGLLKDPFGSCRGAAVTALGALGTPEVLPDLALAVTDSSPRVSGWAREALLHVAPAPAIAELTRLLDQDDLRCRGNLAVALGALRRRDDGGFGVSPDDMADVDRPTIEVLTDAIRPGVAARLVPLLRHPGAAVRRNALTLLGRADARSAGGDIVPLLRDPDAEVRLVAVGVAGDLEVASAADALLESLRDPDPRIQGRSAYSLCQLKCAKALPDLLTLLVQGNSETKRWVVWGLEGFLQPEDSPLLRRALEDPDDEMRNVVVRLLWSAAPVAALPSIVRTIGEQAGRSWTPKPIDGPRRAEVVACLRTLLEDPEMSVRLGAVRMAMKAGLHETAPAVRRLTEDPDADLRSEAVQAVAGFLRRRSIAMVVSRIWDDNDSIRAWACWKLTELGAGDQAIPELIRFLDERGYERGVVDALVNLHARDAVPALTKLLKKNLPGFRLHALTALMQLQEPPALETIRELLEDPDASLRKAAVDVVVALKIRALVPELRAGVRKWESEARLAAIDALGVLQASDAGPDLLPLLEDDDRQLREAAARTLGRLKESRAIPALKGLLADSDFDVRQGAARALGELGAKEAVPDLLHLLRGDEEMGRTAWGAVEAMALLNARESVPDLIRLLMQEIRTQSRPESTVSALQQLDPGAAGRAVLRLLEQEDVVPGRFTGALAQLQNTPLRGSCFFEPQSPPRVLAVEVLTRLGTAEALPVLRRLSRDGDDRLRRAAIVAFIRLAGPERESEIAEFLRDSYWPVRLEALNRLGSLGKGEAPAPLLALLGDPSSDVRRAAVAICARLGGPEVLPRLRALLDDPALAVRVEAASRLCRLGDTTGVPELIREGHSMMSLNAIRMPALWRRLAETPVTEPLQGTERTLLSDIATRFGLSLEIPAFLPASAASGLEERRTFAPDGKRTFLDVLDQLAPRYGAGSFILEEGRLRLVLRQEEWKFWETWSEQARR